MSLKRLASQTVWYGLSNVVARLITYLLTPFLIRVLTGPRGAVEWGAFNNIYSFLPLLNVLFTYGMETAFFRFATDENRLALYRIQTSALLFTTLLLCAAMIVFASSIAEFASIPGRSDYVWLCAAIVGIDTVAALPYARLRAENRPRKYAAIKVVGIVIYVGTVVGLFGMRGWVEAHPGAAFSQWWSRYWGLGFILTANVVQCVFTLGMLWKELADFRPRLDRAVLGQVLRYGWPILLTGFAGQFNDALNRPMFVKYYPGTEEENLVLIGQFSAAARLAVMINLAIAAFRMAGEPFFFSISGDKNARQTYARVMKWFVILLAVMFLSVALYPDLWRYFIKGKEEAMHLVPVLLLFQVAMGIYYNLTVWYKLSNKTIYGTYTVCIGAAVAVGFNLLFIPSMGYAACAWSMLLSAVTMVALSYGWGQKFYPIPYNVKKLGAYLGVALVLWGAQRGVTVVVDSVPLRLVSATGLMGVFVGLVWWAERGELRGMPVVGRLKR